MNKTSSNIYAYPPIALILWVTSIFHPNATSYCIGFALRGGKLAAVGVAGVALARSISRRGQHSAGEADTSSGVDPAPMNRGGVAAGSSEQRNRRVVRKRNGNRAAGEKLGTIHRIHNITLSQLTEPIRYVSQNLL